MPILWRTIFKNYLKVFFLCIFGFLALLILMRMQQIARFATLGTGATKFALFILYQFPAILPTAIPISALISSAILMNRMSQTQELTSLRAQGISIKEILYPIKVISLFLLLINLFIVSELTPKTRIKSKNLIYQASATNPLLLMSLNKMTKLKNSYADLNLKSGGKRADELLFAFINPKTSRLNLILADELRVEDGGMLIGENVAFVSNFDSKSTDGFDHLIVENYGQIENSSLAIANLMHESDVRKLSVQKLGIKELAIKTLFEKEDKQTKQVIIELCRRLYLALITFSFSILGAIFSIQIGRGQRLRGMFAIIALTLVALSAYIVGKSNGSNLQLALLVYLTPHALIAFATVYRRYRLDRGVA